MTQRRSLAHTAYLVTIAIKGFDGALETLAGLLIWITGPQRLYRWAVRLTAPELGGNHEEAALVLTGFIAFMVEKLTHQWSNWLCGFAAFDALTLALVLNEWWRTGRR